MYQCTRTGLRCARPILDRFITYSSQSVSGQAMPQVAVVGGGIAGLVCATELAKQGCRVQVFDMGRHNPGGHRAFRRCEPALSSSTPSRGSDVHPTDGLERHALRSWLPTVHGHRQQSANAFQRVGTERYNQRAAVPSSRCSSSPCAMCCLAAQHVVSGRLAAGVIGRWQGTSGRYDASTGVFVHSEEAEGRADRWACNPTCQQARHVLRMHARLLHADEHGHTNSNMFSLL
jgi:choline dehydrogenase-like flavoprotein